MKRPTRTRLFKRRREVANFGLTGWTQAAIARHIRIAQATVSRNLAAHRCHSPGLPFGPAPATQARHFRVDGPICAHSHDVVARKGRFCATRGFVRELCVSPPHVRAFSDLRTILRDGAVPGEPREYGDSSAGPDWGSGEDRWLAVMLRSFEKLRISAMRDR